MNCSICYDIINLYKTCISCDATICSECYGNCYFEDIFCSRVCFDKLLNKYNCAVSHMRDPLSMVALKIEQYQSELIDYWNYEKDKPIICSSLSDYLINDITNIVLEYLQS